MATRVVANKNVTYSGFIKAEVYHDLLKSMFEKDYTRICYDITELACTKNEYQNMFCFLIEHYSKYGASSNVSVCQNIAHRMRIIDGLSRKHLVFNPVYQKLVCELAMIVVTSCKRAHPHDHVLRDQLVVVDRLEPYLYNYQFKEHPEMAVFSTTTDGEVYKMLSFLYNRMRHNDGVGCTLVLNYLLNVDPRIDGVDFAYVNDIKPNLRNDIVWCLWQVLYLFINKHMKKKSSGAVHKMLEDMFASYIFLYSYQYQKKFKANRINMLFHLYGLCCKSDPKLKAKDIKMTKVTKVSANSKELFMSIIQSETANDILSKAPGYEEKEVVAEKKSGLVKKIGSGMAAAGVVVAPQPVKKTKSLSYLKMYTCVGDDEDGEWSQDEKFLE